MSANQITTSIPTASQTPSLTAINTFDADAQYWMNTYHPDLTVKMNSYATEANALSTQVNGVATAALTGGNFQGAWDSGTVYSLNNVVLYSGDYYRNITGTSSTTNPATDTTNWMNDSTYYVNQSTSASQTIKVLDSESATIDALTVTDTINGTGLIGDGQSVVDYTAVRAGGVTYTNNTDKPIWIQVLVTTTATNGRVVLQVNGNNYAIGITKDAGFAVSAGALVLPDDTYYANIASATLLAWYEMR